MAFLAQVLDCSSLTVLAVTEKFIISGHVVTFYLNNIFFIFFSLFYYFLYSEDHIIY